MVEVPWQGSPLVGNFRQWPRISHGLLCPRNASQSPQRRRHFKPPLKRAEEWDAPVLEGHHQGQAQEEGTLEVSYQKGPAQIGPAPGAGQARGTKGYST
jgi:hypothetical protein